MTSQKRVSEGGYFLSITSTEDLSELESSNLQSENQRTICYRPYLNGEYDGSACLKPRYFSHRFICSTV